MTYHAEVVLVFQETHDGFNSKETLILSGVLRFRVENVGGDHSRQVVKIHLASCLLIHMRERRNPPQEQTDRLHTVAVGLWQQTASQVQNRLPDRLLLHLYY